ncbi:MULTISPECIES: hypothetical protein [unclassified Bradyrhizobium]|uniref:hypothetical protein n=1 Tax=unclassified Bradyrhizobium TaxID=2631580 RepID=UPI0028EF27B6|nr:MULTISPECIES: hypothetical protein [unclassified Bradyrhizobium]
MLLWFLLFVIVLLLLYIVAIRPVLRAMPTFKAFYAEADGFWAKLWAICGRSATIASAYAVGLPSIAMEVIDRLAALLGDPSLNLKQQILDGLQAYPSLVTTAGIVIAAVFIVARLRSISKAVE